MEPLATSVDLPAFVAARLLARNPVSQAFFARESVHLAAVCEEMAERFLRGGRLLAFGRGACATDAQHVAVEFVHPVIVGKRALPALDLSASFETTVPTLVHEQDIVMAFAADDRDAAVAGALAYARTRGALTLSLFRRNGTFAVDAMTSDPCIAQEIIEVLYHTLWETVHVFFDHRGRGQDELGESAFLYPFLDGDAHDMSSVADGVSASIVAKAAVDDALRVQVAGEQGLAISTAIDRTRERLGAGGTLLLFGNGGSATDANDWAIDCATPAPGGRPVRAISLSAEPASLTAIANDVGLDLVFRRLLIAHARPGDVAVAISTSGGSINLLGALEEARSRGLLTLALLGGDGGDIVRRGLADVAIVVPCDYIPRIQEVQASIYHVMTEAWQWHT